MTKIILLPNLLSEDLSEDLFFPKTVGENVRKLDAFIAESRKNAIRYLLRFLNKEKANALPIFLLNEHSTDQDLKEMLQELLRFNFIGLISDQGLPCIADPGAKIVELAYRNNIIVDAISGPSSVFLALMLSGIPSQKFCFQGYLPKNEGDLKKTLKKMESETYKEDMTQVFIETPYRSDKLLKILISNLRPETKLSVAVDLTLPTQKIFSFKVAVWRKKTIFIGKKPAVF